MIVTCSNDETVKIWSADLELIQTLLGHTAFVFAVKALRLGLYVSGGEDRTLKVWADDHCQQDIHLPASVWSIVCIENGDILAAGSDGFVRSFTTDESRRADPDVEEMFNKQILESSSKKSGMNEEEIKKLATTHQMSKAWLIQMHSRGRRKARYGCSATGWCLRPTCGKRAAGRR